MVCPQNGTAVLKGLRAGVFRLRFLYDLSHKKDIFRDQRFVSLRRAHLLTIAYTHYTRYATNTILVEDIVNSWSPYEVLNGPCISDPPRVDTRYLFPPKITVGKHTNARTQVDDR